MAAELFAYGSQIGYQFSLLDIGGGFPGDKRSREVFHRVTSAINSTLETHFSPETYPGLRVIAEPGMIMDALSVSVYWRLSFIS